MPRNYYGWFTRPVAFGAAESAEPISIARAAALSAHTADSISALRPRQALCLRWYQLQAAVFSVMVWLMDKHARDSHGARPAFLAGRGSNERRASCMPTRVRCTRRHALQECEHHGRWRWEMEVKAGCTRCATAAELSITQLRAHCRAGWLGSCVLPLTQCPAGTAGHPPLPRRPPA